MTTLGRAPALDVEVTQEVIDSATMRNSSHCIVADAVRAHLNAKHPGRFNRFAVDLQTIRFTDRVKNERYTYLSPRSCQVCLVNFDQGIKSEAFNFRLRNGQTTQAGISIAERERSRASYAKAKEQKNDDAKRFVDDLKTVAKSGMRKNKKGGSIPDTFSTKTPPVSVGLRRQFGLRAFDR